MSEKFFIEGINEKQKAFLESEKLFIGIFVWEDGLTMPILFKRLVASKPVEQVSSRKPVTQDTPVEELGEYV